MTKLTAKTTIYLDPKLKKAAKLYSVHSGLSFSQVVQESLIEKLEDLEDLKKALDRDGEETISFAEALKESGLAHQDIAR